MRETEVQQIPLLRTELEQQKVRIDHSFNGFDKQHSVMAMKGECVKGVRERGREGAKGCEKPRKGQRMEQNEKRTEREMDG